MAVSYPSLHWPRVLALALAFSVIPLTVVWQDCRLDREHQALYSFLQRASIQAIAAGPLTVRFSNYSATLEAPDGHVIDSLFLATLGEVRYQTTLGDQRIVYSAGGDTAPFNIHLHGGDLTLRSWLGRERSLWVHCTGGVTEGRNGDWERNGRKRLPSSAQSAESEANSTLGGRLETLVSAASFYTCITLSWLNFFLYT